MNRIRLLLTSIALLALVPVGAALPPPTPTPVPLTFNLYFYDTQHRAGLVPAETMPGESSEIDLGGSLEPEITVQSLFWERTQQEDPRLYQGHPYNFGATSPHFGVLTGVGYVGASLPSAAPNSPGHLGRYPPTYVYPVVGHGRSLSVQAEPLTEVPAGTILNMRSLQAVDDPTSCSLGLAMEAVPGILTRTAVFTATYLPGSSLEAVGFQTWWIPYLTHPGNGTVDFQAIWAPLDPAQYPEYFIRIMDQSALIGPALFTFKADGYETDTLELVLAPLTRYTWSPRLVPDRSDPNPGLGPRGLISGVEIHQESPPPDTDRDGYADWVETYRGTDPGDAASHPVLGDADGDGATDIRDAATLSRSSSPPQDPGLDVNQDNAVDECDARVIYYWSIGKPPYETLPLYPGPEPCPP